MIIKILICSLLILILVIFYMIYVKKYYLSAEQLKNYFNDINLGQSFVLKNNWNNYIKVIDRKIYPPKINPWNDFSIDGREYIWTVIDKKDGWFKLYNKTSGRIKEISITDLIENFIAIENK